MKKIVIVLLILIISISSISIIVFMNRKEHINNEHNSFENKQTEIITLFTRTEEGERIVFEAMTC